MYKIYEVMFESEVPEDNNTNRIVTIVSDDYKKVLAKVPELQKDGETFERIDVETPEELIIL